MFNLSLRQVLTLSAALLLGAFAESNAIKGNAELEEKDKTTNINDLLALAAIQGNTISAAVIKMRSLKSVSTLGKIKVFFSLMADLLNCSRNFVSLERPVTDVEKFRSFNMVALKIKDMRKKDASWIAATESAPDNHNNLVDPNSEEIITSPLLCFKEAEKLFGTVWSQARTVHEDMLPQKAQSYEDFIAGLSMGQCKVEEPAAVNFLPDQEFMDKSGGQEGLQEYFGSGAFKEKLGRLKSFAALKVNTTAEHVAFTFAAFDESLRRTDLLTCALELAKLQHVFADLGTELFAVLQEDLGTFPSLTWVNRLSAARKNADSLLSTFGDDASDIFAKSSVERASSVEEDAYGHLKCFINSLERNMAILRIMSPSLQQVGSTRIILSVEDAFKPIDDIVPKGYEAYCLFGGPMRDEDAIRLLVQNSTSQVGKLNEFKETLTGRILAAKALMIHGFQFQSCLDAAMSAFVGANAFIAALGMLNLMFCRECTSRLAEQAMVSVKALHMWPYADTALEASRMKALMGDARSLPKDFCAEFVQFVEDKKRQEQENMF